MTSVYEIQEWYSKPGYPDGIKSISGLFEILQYWSDFGPMWFRGEPRQYTTPLMPSISRGATRFTSIEGTNITQEECSVIRKFQKNHPNDPYFMKFLQDPDPEDVNWVPYAQHYRFQTRLLDITRNALVALYFACEKDTNYDGWIFVFSKDSYCEQKKLVDTLSRRDIGIGIPAKYTKLFDSDENGPVKLSNDVGYAFQPLIPNARLNAQQGAFLWRVDPRLALTQNQVIPLRVKSEAKNDILQMLSIIGIDRVSLHL